MTGSPVSRFGMGVFGASLILATGIMVGWFFELVPLIEVSPPYAPVLVNSGVALFLVSLGFLSLNTQFRKVWSAAFVKFCFIFPILWGALVIVESLVDLNFPLKTIFFQRVAPINTAYGINPKVSPYTGIVFLFLGLSGLLTLTRKTFAVQVGRFISGFIVFTAGVATTFGYISGISAGQYWSDTSQMSPQIGFAATIIGFYLQLNSVLADEKRSSSQRVYFAASLPFFVFLGTDLGVWNTLNLDRNLRLKEYLRIAERDFSGELVEALQRSESEFRAIFHFWNNQNFTGDLSSGLVTFVNQNIYVDFLSVTDQDRSSHLFISSEKDIAPENVADVIATLHLDTTNPASIYTNNLGGQLGGHILYMIRFPGADDKSWQLAIEGIDFRQLINAIADRFVKDGLGFHLSDSNHVYYQSAYPIPNDQAMATELNLLSGNLKLKVLTFPIRSRLPAVDSNLDLILLILGVVTAILSFLAAKFLTELKLSEKDLMRTRQAADEASQAKSQFLANMSHEIRTPLNAISGFSELMALNPCQNTVHQKSINGIQRNSSLLKDLIQDILNLAKIEAGHIEVQKGPVSLVDLGVGIYLALDSKIRTQGIEFEFRSRGEIPEVIITDFVKLQQIILNIAGNALKFTEYGFVDICFLADRESGRLEIEVKDSGIGISEENQKHLFEPFVQADGSIARKFGGTGLGLVLSRNLARHLNGDLILKASKPGIGSVFLISIAMEVAPQSPWIKDLSERIKVRLQRNITTETNLPQFNGIRALVVDDADDSRLITVSFLKIMGIETREASNGTLAIEEYKNSRFDFVLMDLQMPVLNGYAAFRAIREIDNKASIIALTANALQVERDYCLDLGFFDYLTKPMSMHDLKISLEKLLYNKSPSKNSIASLSDDIKSKLLDVFFENTDKRLLRILAGLQSKNFVDIIEAAHQIKGIASSVGMEELTSIAAELEAIASEKQESKIHELELKYRRLKELYESRKTSLATKTTPQVVVS